jgi:hypothetical protein
MDNPTVMICTCISAPSAVHGGPSATVSIFGSAESAVGTAPRIDRKAPHHEPGHDLGGMQQQHGSG